jgi:hypothetical protein
MQAKINKLVQKIVCQMQTETRLIKPFWESKEAIHNNLFNSKLLHLSYQ